VRCVCKSVSAYLVRQYHLPKSWDWLITKGTHSISNDNNSRYVLPFALHGAVWYFRGALMISVLTTSKKALASSSAFGLHIPVMIAQIWVCYRHHVLIVWICFAEKPVVRAANSVTWLTRKWIPVLYCIQFQKIASQPRKQTGCDEINDHECLCVIHTLWFVRCSHDSAGLSVEIRHKHSTSVGGAGRRLRPTTCLFELWV